VSQIVTAVGVDDPHEIERRTLAVESEIDAVLDRLGRRGPGYRQARRLHRMLHNRYLVDYDVLADGVDRIVTHRSYNCLSGSLFYGLILRELGYEVELLEYPGHLLLRIGFNGRWIDVETTARHGFDVVRRTSPWLAAEEKARLESDRYLHPESLREAGEGGPYWHVSLEGAIGFVWLNRAWRTLDSGDSVAAAELARRAHDHLPDQVARTDGVRRLMARAFQAEYERGRFEAAYRIAEIEVGLYPEMTTARDRILAAAMKQVEHASETGDLRAAETVLQGIERTCGSSPDTARLERRAWPLIATAAVREQNWPLARRAAQRYAELEPDEVESSRLLDWVESRSRPEQARVGNGSGRIGGADGLIRSH
jgi:regulator of sirC expression with transglutaminase-like and TPR domain